VQKIAQVVEICAKTPKLINSIIFARTKQG